jgi:hypothetical protein
MIKDNGATRSGSTGGRRLYGTGTACGIAAPASQSGHGAWRFSH